MQGPVFGKDYKPAYLDKFDWTAPERQQPHEKPEKPHQQNVDTNRYEGGSHNSQHNPNTSHIHPPEKSPPPIHLLPETTFDPLYVVPRHVTDRRPRARIIAPAWNPITSTTAAG